MVKVFRSSPGRRSSAVRSTLTAVVVALIASAYALAHPDRVADQLIVQRLLAASSLRDARRSLIGSGIAELGEIELGARLFRHLMALPIAYFQARRVGDSVARVRELENPFGARIERPVHRGAEPGHPPAGRADRLRDVARGVGRRRTGGHPLLRLLEQPRALLGRPQYDRAGAENPRGDGSLQ